MNCGEEALREASWIWLRDEKISADCYACFRRKFRVARPGGEAWLAIAADSDFVAWLNGTEIARGQFSDFARSKTYGKFPVGPLLRRGENTLAVEVFHRGEDFSEHQAGRAGLLAALQTGAQVVGSDQQWKAMRHPAFRSGNRERMTPQCGFTFQFDARKENRWRQPAFDDRNWKTAAVVQARAIGEFWTELAPRPLPSLIVGELPAVRIAAQGSLVRLAPARSAAEAIARSALRAERPDEVFAARRKPPGVYAGPPRNPARAFAPDSGEALTLRPPAAGTGGRYFILDLGAETVGLLEFEVTAEAGTILEIAHGEHLDDGRVRARIEMRNFADRYICRAGRQRFQMPFRRIGARYLEVHVSRFEHLRVHAFSLRKVEYPTTRKGRFQSSDAVVNRLQEMAVRTLELCRHEHYEDSPWREQSLYAYDARLQALYGYHAFGDYRFPEVSFSLLGRSLNEKGVIALCAPGEVRVNIPIFGFVWVAAVAEHWLYSGAPTLFRVHADAIKAILAHAFARPDAATGLYRPPESPEFWHFYEWTPGLCGRLGHDRLNGAHHAAYNLHLHEAGRAHAWMLAGAGRGAEARALGARLETLRRAIHRAFWDDAAGIYRSVLHADGKREGAHELVQALALGEGVAPKPARARALASLLSGSSVPCTLSAAFYLLRAALNATPAARAWMHGRLAGAWRRMAFSGATTMWETAAGGDDFNYAGSLCHGWSALPVYYHQAALLGVYPLAPGFAKFAIAITPAGHARAEGVVPTPRGNIFLRWEKTPRGLRVEARGPRQCAPVLVRFPETSVHRVTYNRSRVR